MIAQCKKNYIQWDVEKYFKKDKLYKYKNIEFWYKDYHGRSRLATKSVYYNKNIYLNFTDHEFEEYFHSEKNIRKLKLKKLNNIYG
jgi:hypothetical protein